MEVEVNIKRTDIVKMQYYTLFKIRANLYWYLILVLASGIGTNKAIFQSGIHAWLLITLATSLLMFFILYNLGVIITTLLATAERGFIGPTQYSINDEYFEEKTKGTETRTRWSSIIGIYQFKKYTFVRINGFRLHIIPNREFENESDYKMFCSQIQKKFDNA